MPCCRSVPILDTQHRGPLGPSPLWREARNGVVTQGGQRVVCFPQFLLLEEHSQLQSSCQVLSLECREAFSRSPGPLVHSPSGVQPGLKGSEGAENAGEFRVQRGPEARPAPAAAAPPPAAASGRRSPGPRPPAPSAPPWERREEKLPLPHPPLSS